MNTAIYILLGVCLVMMLASVAGVILLQHIAHRERMELLKLLKANSLTEFTMDQPKPVKENNNFIRQAMKNAYTREDDE